MSWKRMWTGCEAFNNTKTDADGTQPPRCSRMSTTDDNVCCADALIRDDKHFMLTS